MAGKKILITGSSSGIGLETAIQASSLGAEVILHGTNDVKLNSAISKLHGSGHRYLKVDLKQEDSPSFIESQIDGIDGLVLNAGVTYTSTLRNLNIDKMLSVMDVNFFSNVLILKELLRNNKINKGGSIVATSSTASRIRASIGNVIYAMSKAAVEGYMGVAALELAKLDIRVNCVLPGLIDTNFIGNNGVPKDAYLNDISQYPLKRLGQPDEVSGAILFLISDSSKYITGTSIVVDGGVSRL